MRSVEVTAEQVVAALARDWPLQYEITMLRLVNEALTKRLADLEGGDDAGTSQRRVEQQ